MLLENDWVPQEDTMDSEWKVVRTLTAQSDGARRWDTAYQLLVRWTSEPESLTKTSSTHYLEESNGNRLVCPSLDQSPAASAND
jgi:hypothetical protein